LIPLDLERRAEMALVKEAVGIMTATGNWTMPREMVVNAQGYDELGVSTTIYGANIASGTSRLVLKTSILEGEERSVTLGTLFEGTDAPATLPDTAFKVFKGSGDPEAGEKCGFGRYLEVGVDQDDPGSTITFDVQFILKP
jgi:hypothetical protein